MPYTQKQKQVIDYNKGRLLVSASAGSGKTAVVIDRIIRLITEENVSVDSILAMTFTEAAAREIKDRLRLAIIKQINISNEILEQIENLHSFSFNDAQKLKLNDKDDCETKDKILTIIKNKIQEHDSSITDCSDVKTKVVAELTGKINSLRLNMDKIAMSDISTIHSFCLNLIKRYFFEIGLDASFGICDEKDKETLLVTALDNVFEEKYASEDKDFEFLFSKYVKKRKDNSLKEIVRKIYEFCESEESIDSVLERSICTYENGVELIREYYKEEVSTLYNQIDFDCNAVLSSNCEDRFKEYVVSFLSWFSLINKDKEDVFSYATHPDEQAKIIKKPNNNSKDPETKNVYGDLVEKYNTLIGIMATVGTTQEVEEDIKDSKEILYKLFDLVKVYDEEFKRLKKDENLIDFSDMEHLALRILKNDEILESVKSKYEYIFVDEYQDTNAIQEEILTLIENNNICEVGDSKQSIYGFRGCNPQFFINKLNNYSSDNTGDLIQLDDNFRCASNIIKYVNNVFNRVFTKSTIGFNYMDNPMIYGGLYGNYEGVVCIDNINGKPTEEREFNYGKGVYSVKEDAFKMDKEGYSLQTMTIVELVQQALMKEYYNIKRVSDREDDKIEKYSYKDIVILSSSRNHFQEIINALTEKGIPAVGEFDNSIKNFPETVSLINLFELMTCMNQDIPLANSMLEFGNFTEDDLVSIKKQGNKGYFYECVIELRNEGTELGQKIDKFFTYINDLRVLADFMDAGEIISKVINDTKWDLKLLSMPFGKQRLDRVERILMECTNVKKRFTVFEFLSYLKMSQDKINELTINSDNAVRLMTIHASKGLEFPYVILCDTYKKINVEDTTGRVIMSRKYGVTINIIDEKTMIEQKSAVRNFVSSYVKQTLINEEARKLYVALTRAKYELHVITYDDYFENNNLTMCRCFLRKEDAPVIEWSYNVDSNDEEENTGETNQPSINEEEKQPCSVQPDKEVVSKIKENILKKYEHKEDCFIPIKESVSAINKKFHSDERVERINDTSDAETGTVYHRILELIDFYTDDLEGDISRLKDSGKLTEDEYNSINIDKVKAILSMDIFKKIKDFTLYKEQRFYSLVDANDIGYDGSEARVLIQGIIDLIAVNGNEVYLIDYKLSTIKNDSDLINTYKKQMLLYKDAIEKILKKKVVKVYLVNILQCKDIEVEI